MKLFDRFSARHLLIIGGFVLCGLAVGQFMSGYSAAADGAEPIHDHSTHDHDDGDGLDIVRLGGEEADDDHSDHEHEDIEIDPAVGTVRQDVVEQWVAPVDVELAMVRFGASEDQRADVTRLLLAQAVFAEASRSAGLVAEADTNEAHALAYELHLREELAPSMDEIETFYNDWLVGLASEQGDMVPFEETVDVIGESLLLDRIDERYIELLREFGLLG